MMGKETTVVRMQKKKHVLIKAILTQTVIQYLSAWIQGSLSRRSKQRENRNS